MSTHQESEYRRLQKEQIKHDLQHSLQRVLGYELTPSNFPHYVRDVFNLLTEVIETAKKQFLILEPRANFQGAVLENEAFKCFDIQNIDGILGQIEETRMLMESIIMGIQEVPKTKRVITPPGVSEVERFEELGEPQPSSEEDSSRLELLIYILSRECRVSFKNIHVLEGAVGESMYRSLPYYRVEVPSLDRVVYVCNQADNVTYIFSFSEVEKTGVTIDELDLLTKQRKNQLILANPTMGVRLVQQDGWREKVFDALSKPIVPRKKYWLQNRKKDGNGLQEKQELPVVLRGELHEWRGFWEETPAIHWGTRSAIAKKLLVTNKMIAKLVKGKDLQGSDFVMRKIIGLMGSEETAYCFERVEEILLKKRPPTSYMSDTDPEMLSSTSSEPLIAGVARGSEYFPSGEGWAHFYTGPNGKHYGTFNAIGVHLECSPRTLEKYVAESGVSLAPMYFTLGAPARYAYEDIVVIPRIAEILRHPFVAKEGKWRGFVTEANDSHWATKHQLDKSFGFTFGTVESLLERHPYLPNKKIVVNFTVQDGYSWEDIDKLKDVFNPHEG
jgi:hypothetical protein